jgi:hypothetical protein
MCSTFIIILLTLAMRTSSQNIMHLLSSGQSTIMDLHRPKFKRVSAEPGSIQAILIANPELRVNPLVWRAEHLQHLGCELQPCAASPDSTEVEKDMLDSDQWLEIRAAVWNVQACPREMGRDIQMRPLIVQLTKAATPIQLKGYFPIHLLGLRPR